jgi:predicted RNA-binding protein with PIN domain
MRTLVEQLERFADGTGEAVTVVFDGKPFDLEGESVDVLFASRRGRNAADDDIAAIVQRDADPGELSVVTSDADLAARVRAAGAAVVGAGEFRRRLDDG